MTLLIDQPVKDERAILEPRSLTEQDALMMLETAVVSHGATYAAPSYGRYAEYVRNDHGLCDPDLARGAECMIGVAFHHLGFSISDLVKMDQMMGPFNKTNFEILFPGWKITERAALMLRVAQVSQDKGDPWGIAYHRAMGTMLGLN